MSKSNEGRKSGAGPWSLLVLAFIVATVFYYFDPCGCNLVVRHIPWLVRLIGESAVCIGAGAMALLIKNWAMDDFERTNWFCSSVGSLLAVATLAKT